MGSTRRQEIRARETRFIMSFDLQKLNRRLIILLSVFITLNCFDALTTLVALNAGPTFIELNPIAAGLFNLSFNGFIVALTLKYIPIVPMIYATYLRESASHQLPFRMVKVSTFIALAAADIFYLVVVGSNVRTLAAYYLAR